jgi:hypothetical protein
MAEMNNNEIISRLERVERENKRLKRIGPVGLLLVGTLVVMTQAPARLRTLEAERLVIRYPNGKEAIVLEAGMVDGARAAFHYPNGEEGISLEASPRPYLGAIAYFQPLGTTNGVRISAFAEESWFQINSPQNKLRLEMRASDYDFAELSMQLPATGPPPGLRPYILSVDSSGNITQRLWSKNGTLQLRNGPTGAAVQLLDNQEHPRAVLGNTSLETTRTGSIESRPLSSLVLFDKDGKVLWNAP